MFDLNYLNQLIEDQVEEGPELEYKRGASLQPDNTATTEMSKDISSFANSNGGVLIYGISENTTNRNLPGEIDPVNRKYFSKERLENILNSKIRPRIHSLKIHVIIIPEDQDQVVYVLEIPKGETAHQAEDKRYYRRHNFTVEALFDHEVRDVMGRQKNPDLTIDFEIAERSKFKPGLQLNPVLTGIPNYPYLLNIYADNVGKVYAKYINIILIIPQRCITGKEYDRFNNATEQVKVDNKVRDLVAPDGERYYHIGQIAKAPQYAAARYEPILPGMRLLLASIPIHEYSTDVGNKVSWTIYYDNAVPKTGAIEFAEMPRF